LIEWYKWRQIDQVLDNQQQVSTLQTEQYRPLRTKSKVELSNEWKDQRWDLLLAKLLVDMAGQIDQPLFKGNFSLKLMRYQMCVVPVQIDRRDDAN